MLKTSVFTCVGPRNREALRVGQNGVSGRGATRKDRRIRFHDLRHTFARGGRRGVDLATVAELLGHSVIITMRYAHPTPETKTKAVEALASCGAMKSRIDTIFRHQRTQDNSLIFYE
jgi:integrase